jgi:hypothetical protein
MFQENKVSPVEIRERLSELINQVVFGKHRLLFATAIYPGRGKSFGPGINSLIFADLGWQHKTWEKNEKLKAGKRFLRRHSGRNGCGGDFKKNRIQGNKGFRSG